MGFSASCPNCGGEWDVYQELVGQTATSFGTCAFRCEVCGIAFSNSTDPDQRRRITREPAANVPVEVRGPEAVLRRAVNVQNREKKERAFCSESSEDAVVWTVVSGLRQLERLHALTDLPASDPPTVLLWGAFDDGPESRVLADELAEVCTDFGEDRSSLSEPDIVLAWNGGVVFVEAKYQSPNPPQPDYHGFPKYFRNDDDFAVDVAEVASVGLYELTRNWVIGNEIARRRDAAFTLINLGGPDLEQTAAEFSSQVDQGERKRFLHRRWREVLDSAAPLPCWFETYARERELRDL